MVLFFFIIAVDVVDVIVLMVDALLWFVVINFVVITTLVRVFKFICQRSDMLNFMVYCTRQS